MCIVSSSPTIDPEQPPSLPTTTPPPPAGVVSGNGGNGGGGGNFLGIVEKNNNSNGTNNEINRCIDDGRLLVIVINAIKLCYVILPASLSMRLPSGDKDEGDLLISYYLWVDAGMIAVYACGIYGAWKVRGWAVLLASAMYLLQAVYFGGLSLVSVIRLFRFAGSFSSGYIFLVGILWGVVGFCLNMFSFRAHLRLVELMNNNNKDHNDFREKLVPMQFRDLLLSPPPPDCRPPAPAPAATW